MGSRDFQYPGKLVFSQKYFRIFWQLRYSKKLYIFISHYLSIIILIHSLNSKIMRNHVYTVYDTDIQLLSLIRTQEDNRQQYKEQTMGLAVNTSVGQSMETMPSTFRKTLLLFRDRETCLTWKLRCRKN